MLSCGGPSAGGPPCFFWGGRGFCLCYNCNYMYFGLLLGWCFYVALAVLFVFPNPPVYTNLSLFSLLIYCLPHSIQYPCQKKRSISDSPISSTSIVYLFNQLLFCAWLFEKCCCIWEASGKTTLLSCLCRLLACWYFNILLIFIYYTYGMLCAQTYSSRDSIVFFCPSCKGCIMVTLYHILNLSKCPD